MLLRTTVYLDWTQEGMEAKRPGLHSRGNGSKEMGQQAEGLKCSTVEDGLPGVASPKMRDNTTLERWGVTQPCKKHLALQTEDTEEQRQ